MLTKFACICAFAARVLADANQFTNPDGTKDDFTSTFTVGSTIEVQWQSGWFGIGDRQNPVDLFVTGYKADSYVNVVARNISLDKPGSYKWKIDVPESAINVDNGFVLRFTQARDPPNYGTTTALGMSPSRGFRLKVASSSTSSRSATATLGSSTSVRSSSTRPTSTSSSNSGSSASTPKTTSKKKKGKKNLGGILGGVLGGLAVLIGALVALLAAMKKKQKKGQEKDAEKDQAKEAHETGTAEMAPSAVKYGQYEPVPQELESNEVRHEADGNFAGHQPK